MSNQHADLSQTLAEQHRTELREQAAQARLVHSAGRPRRRRHRWLPHRWRQWARWPSASTQPAVDRPHHVR